MLIALRHLICLCLMLTMAVTLSPQSALASALRTMRFEHVGLDLGLPMQAVQTIVADEEHSLNAGRVRQVYFDKQDRIWIATTAGGLHLYDTKKNQFQRFTIAAEPASHVQNSAINDILDDGQQGSWLATENGLGHFVSASGKICRWHHQHTHCVVSLGFASLHFAVPQSNRFACQLQGFDQDWVYTDASRRFATYTNLDAGEYLLRVKATNKDGIWDETGVQPRITTTPLFWNTWWFRLLLAGLALFALWAIYRYHLYQLILQKKLLETEVDKRTAEIALQKQEIEIKSAELEKNVGVLALANQQQLEHQSELTRFLAVASHDLRQPMHALNLYLEALSFEELSTSSKGLLYKLKKCAHTMDGMFLSLLDLSRLDAKIIEPELSKFPLGLLLKKIELEFAPQAQAKKLALIVEDTEASILCDINLLEQILRNLVANALRYTIEGQVALNCVEDGDYVRLMISDTGIGISPHQQETVFREFFQAHGAGTDTGTPRRDCTKGLGLGLAIVKRLTDLLRMPMELQSKPGHGSQFSLLLNKVDVFDDDVLPEPFDSAYSNLLEGRHIIIIDDDVAILNATQSWLMQWYCIVTAARSSTEVIKKIADDMSIPDVIISDFHLAGNEAGTHAINSLRDMFNHDIPALIITGDIHAESQLKNGDDDVPVLHKPAPTELLYQTLCHLLTQSEIQSTE